MLYQYYVYNLMIIVENIRKWMSQEYDALHNYVLYRKSFNFHFHSFFIFI